MNRAMWRETPIAAMLRKKRAEQAQQDELADQLSAYARANGEDGDDDDDSVSDDSSEFVKSIRTVSLEPARNMEYESFFYPKKERNFLVPILESLSDVTANINMMFRFMRLCMARANQMSQNTDEQNEQLISSIFVQIFQSKRTSGSIEQDVVNFMRASRRTAHSFHNVYRSKRYNEGLDVVLMGAGADPEKEGLPAPYFGVEDFQLGRSEYLMTHNDHPMTEHRRRGTWQSPIGEKILAAAREMHMFLFGTVASSERMIHRGVALDTKFTDLERIWVKNTGLKLPTAGEIITDMVVSNPFAEQFLQIELIKQPSQAVKAFTEKVRNERPQFGESQLSPTATNSKIEDALNGANPKITPESELLNVTLRTSIRFTLESDIAHFVSQTPDSERPSLTRANSWFSLYIAQVLRARVSGTGKAYKVSNAAAIKMEHIPRYATSASTLKKVPALREQFGYVVERTKGNAENMYITPQGTMAVRPSIDALQKTTLAEDFEKVSEELLELLSRNEIPLAAFQDDHRAEKWPWVDAQDLERMQELVQELEEFNGCSLGFDWDFGINIQATSTPGRTVTSTSVGAVTPDSLAVADWLGFDLANDGEKPMKRSFAQAMYTLNHPEHTAWAYRRAEDLYGAADDHLKFAKSGLVSNLINLYMRLAYVDNKAPKLTEMLGSAMRALNYTKLPTEPGFDFSTDYLKFLTQDGSLPDRAKGNTRGVILGLLETAMDMASGAQGTHLWNETFENLRNGDKTPRASEVSLELENHPDYFNSSISTTAEFARLYRYFGGQVFKQILDAINSVEIEHFANARHGSQQVELGEIPDRPGQQFSISLPLQPNATLYRDVLPFAVMLGKYAPNSETIFAEATEQVESIKPDPSFSSDDIKFPGMIGEDRAIFPHQENVQSSLRKKNPPSFAILALAPGGGKTGQGIIDIACLMADMKEAGTVVNPLVICPNGLINTWCEEMKYFQGSNWNAFPISSDVLKRWTAKNAPGEKFLSDLAKNAPPNTIYISSMTFIQGRNTRVCIGSAQVNFSQNLELIRRLGCNYVAIDESHNLKSFKSARHRAVKILTSSTTVKWLRLLTGTIMPDRAKDIEGQIALKAPHVFRAGDIANIKPDQEAEKDSGQVKIGDRIITTYTPLNGKRAVDKLGHYISFIVKEKKDWAYMLPSAIESFHPVPMVDYDGADGTSPAEIEAQKLHEQLYRLVLDRTLEEMEPLLRQKAKAEALADKEGDDDGDDDDDDGGAGDNFVDNDSDFSGESIAQKLWEKNLARFERLIICPQEDEAFEEVFGSMGEGFISRKAKYIANLAAKHFNPQKWKRGNRYIELDLVDFEGQLYVARKYNPGETRVVLPDIVMSKTPVEAPDYWKPEPKGKLIIITRYNASARAVYEALPPNYQAMAVKFTGDEPDRVKAFNDFKTDERVQILIANEQGMSEGHNLQLASRMIRAEAPWGPGALAQTAARVWRPDAKGAIAAAKGEGGLTRDVVYLDWVLADNTMEVPKLARVISKTFGVARITEASNPLYKDLLSSVVVPTEKEDARLALSVDMLASTAGLDDEPFNEMVDAYSRLNAVESKEFAEMRSTMKADMLPIEAAPNIEGSSRMELIPFVANQPIPDHNNWGLLNVEVLMRDAEILKDYRNQLLTKPVVTEWGTGRIVGFNTRGGGLSSLIVNLKNPPAGMSGRVTVQVNMAYIAQKNITPDQEARFFDVSTAGTDTEEKRTAARQKRLEEQQRKQAEIEEREERIRKKQEGEKIRVIKKEAKDGEKRAENETKGRPLNEGIYDTGGTVKIGGGKKLKPTDNPKVGVIVEQEDFPEEDAEAPAVALYPAYYHGFATLDAQVETGDVNLAKLGFQFTPAYAYINVSNKKKFHAIYDWVYENFEVNQKLNDMFASINSAFDGGDKNIHKLWYRLELAPVSELPAFFSVQKRMSSNRRAIRLFPIFTEEHVMICVDIRTNPGIVKHIGKAVPNAGAKWMKSDGEWMYFGKNKTDLKAKVAEVARTVEVSNKDQALKELSELTFKYKTR